MRDPPIRLKLSLISSQMLFLDFKVYHLTKYFEYLLRCSSSHQWRVAIDKGLAQWTNYSGVSLVPFIYGTGDFAFWARLHKSIKIYIKRMPTRRRYY